MRRLLKEATVCPSRNEAGKMETFLIATPIVGATFQSRAAEREERRSIRNTLNQILLAVAIRQKEKQRRRRQKRK